MMTQLRGEAQGQMSHWDVEKGRDKSARFRKCISRKRKTSLAAGTPNGKFFVSRFLV
jgi:hypothetical protein